MLHVVASGSWLYDGLVPTTVRIVRTDFDFWHEIGTADGEVEAGEVAELDASGHLYHVVHDQQLIEPDGRFWPASQGFLSIAEAQRAAQSRLPGPVTWTTGTPVDGE